MRGRGRREENDLECPLPLQEDSQSTCSFHNPSSLMKGWRRGRVSHCPNSHHSSLPTTGLQYKSRAQQAHCLGPKRFYGRPLDLLHIPPSWAVSLQSLGIHSRFKIRCCLLSKVWGVESAEHILRGMAPISLIGGTKRSPDCPLSSQQN